MQISEFGKGNVIDLDGMWMMKGLSPGDGIKHEIYLPGARLDSCLPCRVPGTVRTALLEADKIPDPYYGYDNEKSMWVEQKEWWLFREFSVPVDFRGNYTDLVFEGTSFSGGCWLNGHRIGELRGMLNPRSFDVTRLLNYGGVNYIAVRLEAPPDAGKNTIERGLTWWSLRDQLYSIAQCMYGWDWGPHAVPVGIWKSVALRTTGPVRIRNPHVATTVPSSDRAVCKFEIEAVNVSDKPVSVKLSGTVSEKGPSRTAGEFSGIVQMNPGGEKKLCFEVVVPNPKLWWPNEMGEQNMYTVDASVSCNGARSDSVHEQFGIRELKLVENEKVGEFLKNMQECIGDSHHLGKIVGSYPWTFEINGKKMFAKGGNWIPADQMLRLSHDRYERLLGLFKDAHFNLLRVWGGGLYETEEFYSLCDEYGILTWQEFLSNRNFSRIDRASFLDGARSAILRLRNHPSLTFWCGGNEFDPDDEGSKAVIDSLAALIQDLDPEREFHRASPYMGDDHYWGVWHRLEPYTNYRLVRPFRSEAGMNAPPVFENYVRFAPEDLLWPPDETFVEYHGEYNPRFQHLKKILRYADEFGESSNMQELIMKSQLYQAIANEFDMEFCRANKFMNSGFLVWQYNDIWPCLSWSIVDWYGTPKPSYYFLKRASRPLHISADFARYLWKAGETIETDICLLNDTQNAAKGLRFTGRFLDCDGKVLVEKSGTAGATVNSSVRISGMKYGIPALMEGKAFFVSVELKDESGRQISDALYPIAVSKTGDLDDYKGVFSQLNELPKVSLMAEPVGSTIEIGKDGKGSCEFRISNPTSGIAYFIRVKMVEESESLRADYSDNYISLLPSEMKTVSVRVITKDPVRTPHSLHFEVAGINCPTAELALRLSRQ